MTKKTGTLSPYSDWPLVFDTIVLQYHNEIFVYHFIFIHKLYSVSFYLETNKYISISISSRINLVCCDIGYCHNDFVATKLFLLHIVAKIDMYSIL
jgi:hypothetical protein